MILGLVALGAFVVGLFILVALVITGGPVVWISTSLLVVWAARRVWRWLDRPVCVDAGGPP